MMVLGRSMLGCVALAMLSVVTPAEVSSQTKLLRFPDIHRDRVAFVYAGDIWVAPASGGSAIRLTADPGLELFPKFSPDGQWIAFTGQYDGDEQVYVMPAEGGIPKQLTFYPARGPLAPRWGYDNQVNGWTRDGSAILFRSSRGDSWDLTDSRLYTVAREGGFPQAVAMPVAGAGAFAPDGNRIAYSFPFRDFRSWKRHEGGWAQDIYLFDLTDNSSRQLTDHARADRDPLWIGDLIYFTSDRDGTNNLFSLDPGSGTITQLTNYDVWDLRWPSTDGAGQIVYELNGELVVYDVPQNRATPISIEVLTDGVHMRPSRISVSDNVEDFELSPKGERALLVARGDVFTVPIEHGPTRNLTNSTGAHDKHARWSPDGSQIAFVSDMTGEEELYVIGQEGGASRQLTSGSSAMMYAPVWSNDNSLLAYGDKNGRVYVVDVEGGDRTEVVDAVQGQVTDYTWSPRGGYLAFTMNHHSGFSSVYVYDLSERRVHQITSEYFNDFSPSWGTKGDYLYYLSDRALAPQVGSFEWNYVVDRETYVYALALREDVAHPFPPQSDEVTVAGDEEEDSSGDDSEEASGPIEIDFDGLADRVVRVPITADNLGSLTAVEGQLLYVRGGPFYYGRASDVRPEIKIFSLKDREESTLVENVSGAALSHDGKKILVRQGGAYALYDVKANASGSKKSVSTAGMMVDRVPAREWEQIFEEVWRRFRDWFYVENMHGYDWEALREQYRPWLDHVAHRSDLNYVISEMIAELTVSHAYISGGDYLQPERPSFALLGARLDLDANSGRYQVGRIYRGDNAEDRYRTPLMEVGVAVSEGDYILAIDGEELRAPDNPYRVLRDRAGHPLTLTVNDRPDLNGARDVEVNPVSSELSLKYNDWVTQKRNQVVEATDGRVGYLHLPDMGSNGIREFIKWYYGQIRKEGLVVDVRGNGGGNVSQMILNRLARELWGTRFSRTFDLPSTYPNQVFYGHMVALINETSASDGDIFPARFKKAGLGPLIGKRTWGGVIGITNHGTLIDGGTVNVPQFGTNDVDGSWILENRGVEPDIEVENTPESVIAGRDLQLERAIAEVMRMIEEDPKRLPDRPADPVKTK